MSPPDPLAEAEGRNYNYGKPLHVHIVMEGVMGDGGGVRVKGDHSPKSIF
jgi:hypothetical protein